MRMTSFQRIVIGGAVVLLAVGSLSSAAAPDSLIVRYTTGSGLYVREAPSPSAKTTLLVPYGTRLEVRATTNTSTVGGTNAPWFHVSALGGYVSDAYLAATRPTGYKPLVLWSVFEAYEVIAIRELRLNNGIAALLYTSFSPEYRRHLRIMVGNYTVENDRIVLSFSKDGFLPRHAPRRTGNRLDGSVRGGHGYQAHSGNMVLVR